MKVLHFYPDTDSMITQYVNMLCSVMEESVESAIANNLNALRKLINNQRPDILHLHGCWNISAAFAMRMARKKGIRTVLTPHGQLEQWIIKQKYWKEKLPKIILYQRGIVRRAYSVIAMGRMEENGLKRLKWNSRIETVRNPLITDTVSKSETARLILGIYQKILDTDVLSIMSIATQNAIEPLIKAGLTGNHLWLNDHEYEALKNPEDIDWRKMYIYAGQENIIRIIRHGMEVMGLSIPELPVSDIACYYPDKFSPSTPLSDDKMTVTDDNSHIVSMIKTARKHTSLKTLTISHIVELSSELRRCNIEDDKAAEMLDKQGLGKFTGRLMHVMADMTGLDEGFMPVPAINDNKSNKIKRIITKHLEI